MYSSLPGWFRSMPVELLSAVLVRLLRVLYTGSDILFLSTFLQYSTDPIAGDFARKKIGRTLHFARVNYLNN